MDTLHEEILVSNDCLAIRVCRTVYDYILTDAVAVAYYETRGLAPILEILRLCSKHSVLVYLVVLAKTCAVHYADIGIYGTVISYDNIVLNVGERIDGNIVAYLCLRADISLVADIAHVVMVYEC